jgi:hypothetical protein
MVFGSKVLQWMVHRVDLLEGVDFTHYVPRFFISGIKKRIELSFCLDWAG